MGKWCVLLLNVMKHLCTRVEAHISDDCVFRRHQQLMKLAIVIMYV